MNTALLLLVLLASPVGGADFVSDSVQHFKEGILIPAGDKIQKWRCDLNADGRDEVLLCLKSHFQKALENHETQAWELYIAEAAPSQKFFKSRGTIEKDHLLSVDDLPERSVGWESVGAP